uniref:NPH3 domain-containing protein n=1 Tax=Nelumbo nucifera TaxID=4432 RepID=A0A822XVR6_NELNU|nr:TPA_asm: hypothetical protein HUJ06_025306 [Nelumbo nucifera]
MKFMKLGTRHDTFYTEEANRSVSSDVPSDLTIQINNIKYLLHKFPLLPKCGLLQGLCSDTDNPSEISVVELHLIPGGEEAFELCAKFCYGIAISLSARNIVPALCAAKFLRMNESVEKGNFVMKLETFFNSCILEGWKDSIVTLQTTAQLSEWSENLGIIRRCIDSIVEKILTHPSKVTWSFTYTRPGYTEKRHHSVPKDWWTEDISNLKIDLFQCIIAAIKSTNMLPPQLIGEALHVYACRWLPVTTENTVSQTEEAKEKHQKLLESILIRRAGRQLEEATVRDLLFPSYSSTDRHFYDIDLVGAVLESFLIQWRRKGSPEDSESVKVIRKVAQVIDSYLQVVARDVNMPALKVVILAESLPEIARPQHDEIYKAINIYLKEHPDLSKAEKKHLCRILDCRKLSPQVCAHAVRNERLPLRTVVQVLFFEQERGVRPTTHQPPQDEVIPGDGHQMPIHRDKNYSKSKVSDQTNHPKTMRLDEKLAVELEKMVVARREVREADTKKGQEIREEAKSGSKMEAKKMERKSKSKVRETSS